ncbi:MAG: PAS domain S-box protein, partial [Candidatus Binatia bacterium]
MFARTVDEVREELNEQTRVLLLARCRAGLWVLLLSDCVFGLADLRLSAGQAGPLMLLKAVQLGLVAFGLLALRRPLSLREVTLLALVVAAGNCVVSAGVADVRQDFAMLPLDAIVLTMATATVLPWGPRPQLALAAAAGLSVVWASFEVTGAVTEVLDYAGIAMIVAFIVSVYVAYEFDRYRVAIEQRNLELRGYRDVVENANDAILTLDRDYRITGANRGAESIFGYPGTELVGRPMELLLGADDARVLRERWAKSLSGAVRETLLSLEAHRKDGTTVPIEVKARSLGGPHGPGGVQAILRDVTEKRIVEQMRNDFVAMLSHDMKT